MIQPPFFPIKVNISVVANAKNNDENLLNITREQIAQIANNEIKGNFVSVDLTVVREAFLKLPWVRDARVTREWPDGLNVTIEEHQPLAYWGSHALVNIHGEVFRVTLNRSLPIFHRTQRGERSGGYTTVSSIQSNIKPIATIHCRDQFNAALCLAD